MSTTYQRIDHGSVNSTGLIQKRSNNVDFYYVPLAGEVTVDTRYPRTDTTGGIAKRIQFAKFSNCPSFRLSDDGKSVILG